MKKLLLSLALLGAAFSPVFAGSGYRYDSNGKYYHWSSNCNGGYGYDSNGNYYHWTYNGNGGSGYDSNGNYYYWHNNPN